jgi:hypothetical protein
LKQRQSWLCKTSLSLFFSSIGSARESPGETGGEETSIGNLDENPEFIPDGCGDAGSAGERATMSPMHGCQEFSSQQRQNRRSVHNPKRLRGVLR